MPNFEKYTKNHLIVQFKNMNFMIYKVKYISIKQAKKPRFMPCTWRTESLGTILLFTYLIYKGFLLAV